MDPNAQQPQQPLPAQPVQQEVTQEIPHKSQLPKILLMVLGAVVVLGLIGGAYY